MASKHRTSAVLLAALVCGLLAMSTRADTCGCMASNRSRSSYADIIRQTSPVLASEYPLHNATAEWNFAAMEQALKDGEQHHSNIPRLDLPAGYVLPNGVACCWPAASGSVCNMTLMRPA